MNLIPRKLSDWFRRFFHGGLQAIAAEEAAAIQMDVLDAQAKTFHRGIELAQETKQFRQSDDELEQELAAAFAATLRETLQLGKSMLAPMTPDERAEALSRPLSDSSGLSSSLPLATNLAALEASKTNGTTPEPPVRRGPGRPAGVKDSKPRRTAKRLAAESSDVTEPEASSEQS